MELIKNDWSAKDGDEFLQYLITLKNENRVDFCERIINSKLPNLAIPQAKIKAISKEILCGNYLSFLDLKLCTYYDCTAINAQIISKIKDLKTFEKYAIPFIDSMDNWATCDSFCAGIKIKAHNERYFLSFAKTLIESQKVFTRRVGVVLLFKFINETHIDEIFNIISGFKNENEYYVNMALAWLVAECFIKQRDKTLEFLKKDTLNNFVINKSIQKCRDSFRVSESDKAMLKIMKKA